MCMIIFIPETKNKLFLQKMTKKGAETIAQERLFYCFLDLDE